MISKKINELLKLRAFISVATSDLHGRPNAAPKFLLKTENNFIFLVDYIIGRTWENIKINPRVSLSFVDTDTLVGYQINGPVEIIDKGPEYEAIVKELIQKEIDLSTKRIIEGVSRGKVHKGFEVGLSERFVIFKIKVKDVAEIGPSGDLKREMV